MSTTDMRELNRLWYELERRHRRQRWTSLIGCLAALIGLASYVSMVLSK